MQTEAQRLDLRSREELYFLLTEAAAYEHTVMCTYLYALWSLKRSGEGLSDEQAGVVDRWRKTLDEVLREELVHLCEVNNILGALGGAAHLLRPEFPVPPGSFPTDLVFELAPAGEATFQHFLYLERPEGVTLKDGVGFVHPAHFDRAGKSNLVTPTPRDYSSQGQLYHEIGMGIFRLADELGEKDLFCGHPDAQVGGDGFPLEGLSPVRDVETALRVIDVVVLQGEGAPEIRSDSHYARLAEMNDELARLKKDDPSFEPAWPCARNPWLDLGVKPVEQNLVTANAARKAVDLGNSIYALFLRCLTQVFSPTPLPASLSVKLTNIALRLLEPLGAAGETAARLPIADGSTETAGLSFQLPRTGGALAQASAAKILAERASELSEAAEALMDDPIVRDIRSFEGVPGPLRRLAAELDALQLEFEKDFA